MSRSLRPAALIAALSHLTALSVLGTAAGQTAPIGVPPPEAKALVEGPQKPGEAPKIDSKTDGTTITASAGGQAATGNSRLLALTANAAFDTRFNDNGIGFSALANYGRSALPGESIQTTTENLQARARYDRYIIDQASFFLITTGRHDRFQGLDFRLNVDPGFKYLFVVEQANAVWAEAGYDFQYDIRRDDALVDPMMMAPTLEKTATDHSTRAFLGMRHAFNEQVTLSTGIEYLQSIVKTTRNRINFDALFAAKVGAGLAFGVGFGLRYDHAPLPGKATLDTTTNVSLIYSFSDVKEAPAAPPPTPAPPPPSPADTGAPLPATGGAAPSSSNPATPLNAVPTPPPATEPTKPTPP
jgi:hypothetical protein